MKKSDVKIFILDTNVLLHDFSCIYHFQDNDIVIPIVTLEELDKFKKGNVKVLVATDIAARGIDVENVSHVINYQLPMNLDSYIHRIGRTGRAGKFGKAYTFVD